MRDPYSILGVKKNADPDEIKAAWRSKAKTVHPDQNRDDPDATARFAEIGQAYDLLKDPQKRGLYDQARRAAETKRREQTIMQQRQAAREAAERAKAAEKLMEELARAEQRNAAASASAPQPQPNMAAEPQPEATPQETAEDMLERIFGTQARRNANADGAKTAGTSSDDQAGSQDRADAGNSSGIGFFNALMRRLRGMPAASEKAPDITAEAIVTVDDLVSQKTVTIKMPDEREVRLPLEAGATEGHVVRLKGQGLKLPDMARGDLIVTILVSRDERFSLRGHDIHTTLPVTLADAVLGCETTVQTPRGEQLLNVPAWSGSDKAIHIEGQGLQREDGSFGDLVVELRIVLLETPDAKVTDLMRHMREGLYL